MIILLSLNVNFMIEHVSDSRLRELIAQQYYPLDLLHIISNMNLTIYINIYYLVKE